MLRLRTLIVQDFLACSGCPGTPGRSWSRRRRNCMSTVSVPWPSQVSQRPPGWLKLKCPGAEVADLRLGRGGEQVADVVEDLEVRGRVAAGRARQRLLVHAARRRRPGRRRAGAVPGGGSASFLCLCLAQQADTASARPRDDFAGAADAGDGAEHAERKLDRQILQVVERCALRAAASPAACVVVRAFSAAPASARYAPVSEASTVRDTLRAAPGRRRGPPSSPAPGPRSMTWSAARESRLGGARPRPTVLPASRRRCRQADQLCQHRRVQARRGSSSTYRAPTRFAPRRGAQAQPLDVPVAECVAASTLSVR